MEKKKKFQFGLFLVTIGIVYGDIGTSPMYVMKSILEGNGGIGEVSESFIIGSLSLVIWTITLLTTIKYVLIAMKADNHGEGGIFSLYTLVSEAILLDLLPHLEIRYPSDTKGQLYIGKVNTILWIGCSLVVLYFRSGARMESAYGLAITVTMLMTTLLISVYLRKIKKQTILSLVVLVVFGAIEFVFFLSSLGKFSHGGYVTVILTLLLLLLMVVWHRGTELEHRFAHRLPIRKHLADLNNLRKDDRIPLLANNLVYLEGNGDWEEIDRDILYSILTAKYAIRRAAGSKIVWYGLATSPLIIENVPLVIHSGDQTKRIQLLQTDPE